MIRASELECQAAIVEAAMLAGWWVHAERPAQRKSGKWSTAIQGHRGFPDLVLVRPPRMLLVELKRSPNRVEGPQREWLFLLSQLGGPVEERIVWVPEGLDEFIAELVAR